MMTTSLQPRDKANLGYINKHNNQLDGLLKPISDEGKGKKEKETIFHDFQSRTFCPQTQQ